MTQAIFDNIEEFISSQRNQAERSISIVVAWFTNNDLYEMLTKAYEKKVDVNVLLLNDILNRNEFGLDFGVLSKQGAEVCSYYKLRKDDSQLLEFSSKNSILQHLRN